MDFIGTALQFRNAKERMVPRMHNLHHRKKLMLHLLSWYTSGSSRECKKYQTARQNPFFGGW